MKIKLHTINLEVADPQVTKNYRRARDDREPAALAPAGLCVPRVGGRQSTLATPQKAAAAEPSRTMEIGFEVDDLPALQARLEEQKVTGFHSQGMGWADVLEGHDPDGHRVIVYCFKGE